MVEIPVAIETITKLYRYRETQFNEILDDRPTEAARSMRLYLETYPVLRHTTCGVWIDRGFGQKKFVNLCLYKKWAHPTTEDAMESFKARKRRQVAILKHRLLCAQASLHLKVEGAIDLHRGMYQFRTEDPHESY